MTILAFNKDLPQNFQIKYRLAIGILPIFLMFASFLPLIFFANWLESALGIPANSPINNHPNGTLWIVIFICALIFFMLSGYIIGWFGNALISRFILNWSTEMVRAVYLRSEAPIHWLKNNTSSSLETNDQFLEQWEKQRNSGVLHYIFNDGILSFGAPMFIAMYIIPNLIQRRTFTINALLINISLWAVGGIIFGLIMWVISEIKYRKLKKNDA